MTREAKIGMLTGLGVIVLIGVLLSEYLGDSAGGKGGAGSVSSGGATGRMAELPVGSAYRRDVMEPVNVPVMIRDTTGDAHLAGTGGELSSPIVTGLGVIPPAAFAVDPQRNSQTGPTVGRPVSPVVVGPAPMEAP